MFLTLTPWARVIKLFTLDQAEKGFFMDKQSSLFDLNIIDKKMCLTLTPWARVIKLFTLVIETSVLHSGAF
jgi:hypothetical protein